MTICIAAIGTEGKNEFIVFATDHMITTGTGQFEHSFAKYKELNKTTVAMLAGQALLFEDLTQLSDKNIFIDEIKKQIFENFKKKRKEVIENEIFSIYGINQDFFVESLQKPIPNPFIHTILEKVSNFKLGTNILLIGFNDGLAILSEINEGGIFDFRNINFHTIGTGAVQASNTLLFQKHSKNENLSRTIYNVYKSKRNAEVMQGVGKETDVLVLTEDGMRKLSDEKINILKGIYEAELKFGKDDAEFKRVEWC